MTPLYSMKIFAIKTFTNCPETAKFAKVFARERFLLYGSQFLTHFQCQAQDLACFPTEGKREEALLICNAQINSFTMYSTP